MTINIALDKILHPRIIDKCLSLYQGGHFSHAALESMKQVELALKEKGVHKGKLIGVKLVKTLFESENGIKLKIPLGDDLQKQAQTLFEGAFSYYRNYAAHDGSKIDETICIRIMVLASELLDLIGASSISFEGINGVKGLIKQGIFNDKTQIADLLSVLSSQAFPDETFDGMFEDLAEIGCTDNQYQAVFELGLVEYKSRISSDSFPTKTANLITIGWLELTPMGQKILDQVQKFS